MQITLKTAALLLGLEPNTLRRQARRGSLTAKKVGRDWLVTTEEVQRYAKENRRDGTK